MTDIIDFSRGLAIFNDYETRFGLLYVYSEKSWIVYQGESSNTRYLTRDLKWTVRSGDDCRFATKEEALVTLEFAIIHKLNGLMNEVYDLKRFTGRMAG